MTAYSLFWCIICFSEDQIRSFVVTLTTKTECRQSSYVSVKTKYDLLLRRWPPKQTVGSHHMFQTYDDCLQSVLVVSVATKDRVWSSLKHMITAYSLFWWSASQQKIVFGLHWNIWWLPTLCFGGQRHNKRSYLVFTEAYDDCLQSVLVVGNRVLSSLKHMMTAYSLFWWVASQHTPPKQTVGSYHMFQWRQNTIADHQNRL
jgi:hypothetical protein